MNSNEWLCVEHECCEDNRRRAKWKYFLCGHIESAFDLCVKTINGGEQLQREQYSSCHSGFFFWKLGEMCQNHDLIWNSSWNSINVQMVKWISCSHSMASNSNAPNQFGISFVARENDKNVFYTLRPKVTRVSRHTQTEKKKTHHNSAIRSYYSVWFEGPWSWLFFLLPLLLLFIISPKRSRAMLKMRAMCNWMTITATCISKSQPNVAQRWNEKKTHQLAFVHAHTEREGEQKKSTRKSISTINETKIKCLIKLLFVNWLQFEGAFAMLAANKNKETKRTHNPLKERRKKNISNNFTI